MTEPAAPPPEPTRARWRLLPASGPGWIMLISLLAVLLVGGVALVTRFGINSAPGLLFVEARASGLKIGRFGKLRIEGLRGDLWRNFTVKRLTITDEKGVWLEADNLAITWRYHELFVRRFHAETIYAEQVRVLRRPTLTPKTVSKGLPVSIIVDGMRGQVETLPAFSYRRGLFSLVGGFNVQRGGPATIHLGAASQLHLGDRLSLALETGKNRPLLIIADANEARGGALAGALGLPTDQPFLLRARANGRTVGKGSFSLLTTSGATTPAEATGSWTSAGGAASGRLSLAASTLTRRYVPMFGPEVRFAGKGGKAKSGLYDLDARLDGETLSVIARGEADIGKRLTGKKGLALTLDTRTLERLTGGAVGGAAHSQGVLTGRLADFSYVGAVTGSGVKVGGYQLARAEGPVKLLRRKGEWTVETTLTGEGGQGAGYIAALLGARPKADIVAARLADGRLLLRRVKAEGAGLKLDGAGERTLLGGLSFKGQADLTNLEAARAGSKGRASGSWSASQGGAGKPWVFTVDARGAGFATGLAELDRLLGATPRLRGKAEYRTGVVSVSEVQLDGTAGSARTAGVIGPAGALRLKLDWNAKGPFRAGPVEIAGDASGTGAITGTISAPRADLIADFQKVDLPRLPLTDAHVVLSFVQGPGGTDGAVAVTSGSAYGPARARTNFRFAQGGLDLTDLDADAGGIKATGALTLRQGRPSMANLILAIGPGAVLTEGQINGTAVIVDAPGGARATLNLTARNASLRGGGGLRFASATLTADGPLARLPVTLDSRGTYGANRWRFRGSGIFAQQEKSTGLALEGEGRFGSADFKTVEAARLGFGDGQRFADVTLEIEGGRADITARLDGEAADIRANLANVSLGALNEDLAGTVDGVILLQGRGDRLTGSLDASLKGARARGAGRNASLDGRIKAVLNDQVLSIDASASNAGGLRSEAVLTLPVVASAAPLRLAIAAKEPMRGRFSANGEIKPLWDLLVGGERSLSGVVDMNGTIAGSLGDPRLSGHAELKGGVFEDGAIGLSLRAMTVSADLADNAIDVNSFTAADGDGGQLSGGGRISLLRNGVSSFRVGLEDFRLIENDAMTATASGEATLSRAADGKVKLSGALTIDRATIAADPPTPSGVVPMEVIERNKPGSEDGAEVLAETRQGLVVALDVTLKADRGIFIEGRGLDAEMSLDARVTGTTARPVLEGVARIVRGEYDFAGKRFEFDTRSAVYLAASPDRIRLDLTATREDPSLTAVIRVRGTAAKPEITLTSSPVLPNDEVMSRVLFGTSAAQLSPLEAAQLASAIAALAGGGGFDVIGNLRNLTGLDRLVFAGGGESGMTVAGGKYLTDDVYLEIIGGGREGPAAQVEWRVRKNLSIISRLQGDDSKLSVRWRKDY